MRKYSRHNSIHSASTIFIYPWRTGEFKAFNQTLRFITSETLRSQVVISLMHGTVTNCDDPKWLQTHPINQLTSLSRCHEYELFLIVVANCGTSDWNLKKYNTKSKWADCMFQWIRVDSKCKCVFFVSIEWMNECIRRISCWKKKQNRFEFIFAAGFVEVRMNRRFNFNDYSTSLKT